MNERARSPYGESQVNDEFERIEQEETGEGVHDRYLALAERLEIAALQ